MIIITALRAKILKITAAIFGVCLFIGGAVAVDSIDMRVYERTADFHVVIDAGHGGKDRGASSSSGTYESDINLAIAKYLETEFKSRGVGVTMTRIDENSLASAFATNKKRDDMNKRRQIIERVKPDLVISIHLNTFSDPSVRGLQCFYDKSGELSKQYAEAVQTAFNQSVFNINRVAKAGDYYMLDSTEYPAILVECGFLTNPQEEKMLKTREYQRIIASYIAESVVKQNVKNSNILN